MANFSLTMRNEALAAISLAARPQYGLVDSYDPGRHAAKVMLSPSGVLTGFLPVATPFMGNGWGMIAPLQAGDQVLVGFADNHSDGGVILARFYDQLHVPPKPAGAIAQPGEMALVHQSGAYLYLSADGRVRVNAPVEIDIGALGNAVLPLLTSAAAALLNGHTHAGVKAGSDTSGPMLQQLGSSHETTVLKAN